jgi:hypothetical protein
MNMLKKGESIPLYMVTTKLKRYQMTRVFMVIVILPILLILLLIRWLGEVADQVIEFIDDSISGVLLILVKKYRWNSIAQERKKQAKSEAVKVENGK